MRTSQGTAVHYATTLHCTALHYWTTLQHCTALSTLNHTQHCTALSTLNHTQHCTALSTLNHTTALLCTMLYTIEPHYTTLNHTDTLHHTITLNHTIQHWTIQHSTTLHNIEPHCSTAPHYTALNHTTTTLLCTTIYNLEPKYCLIRFMSFLVCRHCFIINLLFLSCCRVVWGPCQTPPKSPPRELW